MNKLKVMTIVGTRPEIIRLSRVIAKLDQNTDHTLVHTGQNYDYELNQIFFDELKIRKPDVFLGCAGANAAETIGRIIIDVDETLEHIKPEAVLILGDTNSCLSAISAKRRKIPIFHMEAGNRCFDMRVPEEVNRKIVDSISDINLTYSSIAREYLLREGFPPDKIIKTGSPMKEVLEFYQDSIQSSNVLTRLNLAKHQYFVFSIHREENVDSPQVLTKYIEIMNGLAKKYSLPIIVSTHPRTEGRLKNIAVNIDELIKFSKPFGFFEYVNLQMNAKCTLSDSGTITEEASILNFPALNLRETHERPEGFEEGAVMFVGSDYQRVLQSLSLLDGQKRGESRSLRIVHDYSVNNVSDKILRIIHSYTNYVNLYTWRKSG
jgi:UDP-N-acetylglucosamine 2-epimerase (non-hydrolysing)